MFEPNSIRSLLKKRNMTKLSSQKQSSMQENQKLNKTCTNFSGISKNNTDPDLQSVIQAKMMIKQIDHDVSNIRMWRQHQKLLLQEKLKNNQQIFKISTEEYEKKAEQKIEYEIMENQKLIEKMRIQQNSFQKNRDGGNSLNNGNSQTLESSEGGQDYEDWQNNLYGSELMNNIAQGEGKINEIKYMKAEEFEGFQDRHQAFLNSFHQLSSSNIFTKKDNSQEFYKVANKDKDTNKTMDKDQLRQQLQDIENELRQMEDLLKD